MAAALTTAGCDGETETDAGIDAGPAIDAFVPAAVCGDGEVEGAEACDDGNTESGDGCSADCASDETCGNGVTDPGETCDDGNTTNGDGCSAGCDSDETCGNGIVDFGVGERCDDGNTTAGDGCSAACDSDETCGNGVVDDGEECDDGNTEPGDGCGPTCGSEACTAPADCDDENPCNGVETCSAGTCAPGTAPSEGTACDADAMASTRDVCVDQACVASICGDRFVDVGATPAEQCDDGDTTGGDGCDDACQLESCTVDADCDDGNPCTAGHSCPTSGTCELGTPMSDGAVCDADAMVGTRDICLSGFCIQSICGDGYVDVGASEECDDGNNASGDGCAADCTIEEVPITAYRIVSASLMDPHLYAVVVGTTCTDVTPSVNTLMADSFATYDLNFVGLFQPLDPTRAMTPLEVAFQASCMAGTTRDDCSPIAGAPTIAATANNTLPASMTCLAPDSAVLNPSYTGTINSPGGPCFVSDEQTFMLSLGGVPVRLQSARLAGTYSGGASPTRLVNGVLVGFLSVADAQATVLDSALPVVGGDTLYEHLAHGGAPGSACEVDTSFTVDDSDTLAGEEGFWLYLNFEAELVDWTP